MANRNLTAGMLAEIAAQVMRPAFLVELETASATINIWSGVGTLIHDSKNWLGVGDFGSISAIPETSGINAVGLVLALSGIPSNMLTLALTDSVPFKPAKVWLAMLDSSGAIIVDPYLAFSGRTDSVKIDEGGETSTISISCESRMIELNRTRVRRYVEEDQIAEFPNDKGFEFVEELQDARLPWGEPGPPQFSESRGRSPRNIDDDDDF